MASGRVHVVSADERWLRVLEVTLRLGASETRSHRSLGDALRASAEDDPAAIVLDVGDKATPEELTAIRHQLRDSPVPAVIILPNRLGAERELFSSDGAIVLVRPYRPSELYRALALTDDGPNSAVDAASAVDPGAGAAVEPGAMAVGEMDLERRTASNEPGPIDES